MQARVLVLISVMLPGFHRGSAAQQMQHNTECSGASTGEVVCIAGDTLVSGIGLDNHELWVCL